MVISAPCYSNEALAIPEQTATGKEISNPFMAGEDCWVLEDFTTYCCWFNIGAASEDLVLLRKYLDIVKAQGLEMHEADPNCMLNVMLYRKSKSKFYVRFYRALSIALYVIGFHVKPTTNGFFTGEIENRRLESSISIETCQYISSCTFYIPMVVPCSTHLKTIRENKFNGYLWTNPHDHIREFLAICDMFKYGETQSEAIKLLIFPFSLCDDAKNWFNELNEESITSWDQMRRAFISGFFPPSLFNHLLLEIKSFSQNICESLNDAWLRLKNMLQKCHGNGVTKGAIIQIFFRGLDEPTLRILNGTAGGIFFYKSPNQAFQFLDDKVLFKLNWSIKSQNKHHQKSVAFVNGSNSNNDNSGLLEKL
ncbi:reverse transcriptase domain-containing protein, partial [Tanacetum coccineum]